MSYNKVIMMGRLTRDPELRSIPSGTPLCEIGIAVDSGWGDNKKTCFIDVTVWGKQAEFVKQWFKKGDGIVIDGRLDLESWEDKNGGGKRSKHRITAERATFPVGAGKKGSGEAAAGQSQDNYKKEEEVDEIPF